MVRIVRVTDGKTKSRYAEAVLRSLPEWFGIEEALRNYVAGVVELPFWAAMADGRCVGFVAAKIHHGHTGDLYVLGVLKDYQAQGIGTKLLAAADEYFVEQGCKYVIVLTLSELAESEPYDRTREFYAKRGFEPLITLPELWDEHNPCLIMIKQLKQVHLGGCC